MPYYSIYNCIVDSALELPVPVGVSDNCSVSIELSTLPLAQLPLSKGKFHCFDVNSQDGLFFYKDVGTFSIQAGKKILVSPAPGVADSFLASSVLGTPMGILFLQRGCFVMHGSALEVAGRSIIFLGKSGIGKSTTALSLLTAGYRMVTDDVVVIDQKLADCPVIYSAFPWMKIDIEVARNFGIDLAGLKELAPGANKMRFNLDEGQFCVDSVPVSCIYIPCWGEKFSIQELSPRDAMVQIAPHSYGPAPRTKYPDETARYFKNAVALVESIPCFKLTRPYGLDRLHELPSVIEKHLLSL